MNKTAYEIAQEAAKQLNGFTAVNQNAPAYLAQTFAELTDGRVKLTVASQRDGSFKVEVHDDNGNGFTSTSASGTRIGARIKRELLPNATPAEVIPADDQDSATFLSKKDRQDIIKELRDFFGK